MRWKPSPPKQSEVDGNKVKKQKVNKLLRRPEEEPVKKVLDKPTKLVYNIRKDMTEVQYLYDNFLADPSKIGRNLPFSYGDRVYAIETANKTVLNILAREDGIPIPKLAGGAIRDLVFNKAPKDYDYFINCDDEDHVYEVIDKVTLALAKDGYEERGENVAQYDTSDDEFDGVYGVFNQTKYNLPLQFIVGVWPDAKEHIYDKFDLSVCQAEMDIETGDMTFSDAFMETLVTQKIKLLRDTKYSRTRKDRLSWDLGLYTSPNSKLKKQTYADLIDLGLQGKALKVYYKNAAREMIYRAGPIELQWAPLPPVQQQ